MSEQTSRYWFLALLLSWLAAAGLFITCARHLQNLVGLHKRTNVRLQGLDDWLSAILESLQKQDSK